MIPELDSLGSLPRAIAAVGLLWAAAYGIGWLAVPAVASKSWQPIHVELLRIAVGLNLTGFAGMVLGTQRLLGSGGSVGLLLFLAFLAVVLVSREWIGRVAVAKRAHSTHSRFPWLVVPVVALVCVTLGPALCYPTGWDELVYHNVLPRRWLADGWPAIYPDLPYSGFPSLGEILFWLMAPIDGVIAPRLLGWVCWMLGLFFVYRVLRRRLEVNSAAVLIGVLAGSSKLLLVSANW